MCLSIGLYKRLHTFKQALLYFLRNKPHTIMMDSKLVIIFIILNCLDLYSACHSRCLTCTARDHCTRCKPIYWDNRQYSVCQRDCPTTCATNECDDRTGICKECPEGFYGDSCQISCDICADGLCDVHKCTNGCKDGFHGVTDYRGIVECRKCIVGCSKCSNYISCDSCGSGYYPHGTSLCIRCPEGCNRCTDRYKCTECVDGKYGVTCEHDCSIPHCGTCSSTRSSCITCQSRFILEDGKCVRIKPTTGRNQPEPEDDITPVDADKATLAGNSHHNVYVYVALGIGLCVTLLIIAFLAGYIVKRRNTNSMNPPNVAPNVIYSHRSGDTNYSDNTRSQNQANAGYHEPNTESTYDHISDDNHQESTPNTTTYDSNGYLQPATITNRQANPYQSYLTPVNVSVPSTDMQPSSYEPLKFEGITNNMYSGLHKPVPAYKSAF